jgi:hypothetical protein
MNRLNSASQSRPRLTLQLRDCRYSGRSSLDLISVNFQPFFGRDVALFGLGRLDDGANLVRLIQHCGDDLLEIEHGGYRCG